MDAAYAYRRAMRVGTADEYEAREKLRFGGRDGSERGVFDGGEGGWTPQDAGIVVVSCERGVIRQSAAGLYVYDDDGRHDEPLSVRGDTRANEVADLVAGIGGHKPLHDGRWGMATLEAVLAIMESAAQRREIYLSHQVSV